MTCYHAVAFAAFLLCGLLTFFLRRILLKHAVLDRPNERSMHKQPTPRGGGLAIMLIVMPGLLLALILKGPFLPHGWILLSLLLLVCVSWIDDRNGLHPGVRLASHLAAAAIGCLALSPEQLVLGGLLPLWADRLVTIVGWAWFTNISNFMDGIDGIAGAETLSLAAGAGVLLSLPGLGDPFSYALVALLIGSCAAFLVFNWHPAMLFLGDVGSITLGFLTGYLLIVLAASHQFAAALILPLYYLADSGITLTKRLLRREKVWQAHREHFYQQAAQATGRHDIVVSWIVLANMALIGAALAAVPYPLAGLGLAFVVVALLLVKMHKTAQS